MTASPESSEIQPTPLISPRTLKGFRDYLPQAMLARETLIDKARQVYRSYGYCPIDTPALEFAEILLGKGGDEADKQMYRFHDNGGRDVGLRFDLTVPLARFVAQHAAELGTPFKRYHIANVWRGENTQRGRYREFMQCDFDAIGTTSLVADIEIVMVIHDLMRAIGMDRFVIHINHRQVLTGLLDGLGLSAQAAAVLRILDKLSKIGPEGVGRELHDVTGTTDDQADRILSLAAIGGNGTSPIAQLQQAVAGSESAQRAVMRLDQVVGGVLAAGIPAECVRIDASIARGLDYYTGIVMETLLSDLPDIGSVCSGGRYDNLVSVYSRQQLPGIGASLGLDRMLAALEELGLVAGSRSPAPVFIPLFLPDRLHDYLRLAAELRAAGIGTEVFSEEKKLSAQLKHADRRGFRLALILGESEFASRSCQLKDLRSGSSESISIADPAALVRAIRDRLDKT